MPYDIESQFRNADFISIAAERQSTTLSAAGAVAPLSEANTTRRRQAATTFGPEGRQPSPLNPVNLLNPLNPHAEGVSKGGHNPRGAAPSTLPSEPFEPSEPYEPSRRRRVP